VDPFVVEEAELPEALEPLDAVAAAYPVEIARVVKALLRGLPALVECEKELAPWLYRVLRDRLKAEGRACLYLDGRPRGDEGAPEGLGFTQLALHQLRDAVRGQSADRVICLPHLDLMTGGAGPLSTEAREVVALLYENPQAQWLAFADPSFPLPRVVENLFPHRESLLGVPRDRLRYLVTRRESRKLGRGLAPYRLYKHLSGLNAVRLRRLLSSLDGEDYPADPDAAVAALRLRTMSGEVSLPTIRLAEDIGGYPQVKQTVEREILALLRRKEQTTDAAEVQRIERLVPRGIIFWGPPGTGKTLFAKAMASALGACVLVVSGPELKSKWVGESEQNLRRIFLQARRSAPSLIIFDELDSFASRRGLYTGSGVEHSMVNQLLTEMDGFRPEELMFVVGTTNLVESLDPALLRPGRFEYHIHVPLPDADDRRAIFSIYDRAFALELSEAALARAVALTGSHAPAGPEVRAHGGVTGDHIQAICRALARHRLREGLSGPTEAADVERAVVGGSGG
jgi:cell division protease FtsH